MAKTNNVTDFIGLSASSLLILESRGLPIHNFIGEYLGSITSTLDKLQTKGILKQHFARKSPVHSVIFIDVKLKS